MNAVFEQALSAQQAVFKTFADISNQALIGAQKLTELNIQTAKTTLAETSEQFQAVAGVNSVSKLAEVGAQLAQPAGEKISAYAKHVYDITSTTGQEIGAALQASAAQGQETYKEFLATASKQAPAGSEPIVNALKSAFQFYQASYDKALAATNQVVANASEFAEKAVPAAKAKRR